MYYSTQPGGPAHGVSIDNVRRTFNFGDTVAYLAAPESVFLSTLMMGSKKITDDPIFKHLERRDQWQRQDFTLESTRATTALSANVNIAGVQLASSVDEYGRVNGLENAPLFLVANDTINLVGQTDTGAADAYEDTMVQARIVSVDTVAATYVSVTLQIVAVNFDTDYATTLAGKSLQFIDGAKGRSTGSAFDEGTGAPDGWTDEIYDREGYTQIFKTSVPVVTGTTLATKYRATPNGSEWARIWNPKMKEHKLGMTRAMLFNTGGNGLEGSTTKRYTNGFIPYVYTYGETAAFTYASTSYDDFMGFMETFMDPERGGQGRKMVVCSRKIFTWANKLGSDGFLQNTLGAAAYNITVQNYRGVFGHQITNVWTPYGEIGFVIENQLRGEWEDYALVVDASNLAYRPLAANGENRETQVKTNIQGNDIDGRKDMILTEAGLQIDLPETHAVWTFS